MILTVANQKGGVGKTTFLVNFAYYMQEQCHKKTCVIDLDSQANCSLVLENEYNLPITADQLFKTILSDKIFNDVNFEQISLIQSSIELIDEDELDQNIYMSNLEKLKEHYDCILIDTAPTVSNRLIASLQKSDFVITPVELELFSLQGLELMLNTISNIKNDYNKNMTFLGVLPSRVNTTNPRQLKSLDDLKIKYGNDLFLPFIRNRNDIANALANQISFFKSKSKHKKELLEVFNFIYKKLGV